MVGHRFSATVRHMLIDRRRRWLAYGVAGVALSIMTVFPQPYLGRARLLPRDPSTALGGALGSSGTRLQDLGALLGGGNRSIDLYLAIAQSADIRTEVIKDLHLVGSSYKYRTEDKASVQLEREVTIQSLPGSVLQIEVKTRDSALALRLTSAFADAISRHLRSINSEQVEVKKALLDQRFHEAAERLSRAQGTLNEFRRRNRISAAPEAELGSALLVKSGVEARLQAKTVELKALEQMLGPDSARLRAAQTEAQGLRDQLAQATSPSSNAGGPNAGGLTELSTQYLSIYRDYLFAQAVYDVYTRLAEQVAVEDVSDRNAPTVQFIETAHLDPGIHTNLGAVAVLVLLVLIAAFTEFYAPATGIDLWRRDEGIAKDER